MSNIFLIEFLLLSGILLLWIGYEYVSVKRLADQREKKKAQNQEKQSQVDEVNN